MRGVHLPSLVPMHPQTRTSATGDKLHALINCEASISSIISIDWFNPIHITIDNSQVVHLSTCKKGLRIKNASKAFFCQPLADQTHHTNITFPTHPTTKTPATEFKSPVLCRKVYRREYPNNSDCSCDSNNVSDYLLIMSFENANCSSLFIK